MIWSSKVLMAAVIMSTALTSEAWSSPRTAQGCPLVTDVTGDATGDSVPSGARADLDITSADFKVVRGQFTAVIRIARLPENDALVSGLGYDLFVTRDKVEYTVAAIVDATGARFHVQTGSASDPTSPYRDTAVSGDFAYGRHEVKITGPASALTLGGSGGSPLFTRFLVRTYDLAVSNSAVFVGSSVDDASTSRTYSVGQRACA